MKRSFVKALAVWVGLLGGESGVECAQAQQLSDLWATNAAIYDGQGGSTYTDRAVGSVTAYVDFPVGAIPVTYAAARTWVLGTNGAVDHWAVVLNRYNYETGLLEAAGESGVGGGNSRVVYPAADGGRQYFVPVAIKVVHTTPDGGSDFGPANYKIIVTGYAPSTSGSRGPKTEFRTLWFNGNLDLEKMVSFFASVAAPVNAPAVDQFPVGMDAETGGPGTNALIGVTGNVWNGSNWDIATVFYDVLGRELNSNIQGTAGVADMAAGISLGGSPLGAFVAGTLNANTIGNTIGGYWYTAQPYLTPWTAPKALPLSVAGATLSANAVTARISTGSQLGVVAGKMSGIDSSYMLLSKFEFVGAGSVNYTAFGPPADPGSGVINASANAVSIATGLIVENDPHTLFAIAGSGWRGAAYGMDSLVCLFDDVGAPFHLRWSSWMNRDDTAHAMDDRCYSVAIDSVVMTTEIDKFYVYATGQVSNGTDLDWRATVYSSAAVIGQDPTDPAIKTPYDNSTLGFSGNTPTPSPFSSDLVEVPISLVPSLNLEGGSAGPRYHNFVVTGNIYNGSTPVDYGADQLTRRIRFFAPE